MIPVLFTLLGALPRVAAHDSILRSGLFRRRRFLGHLGGLFGRLIGLWRCSDQAATLSDARFAPDLTGAIFL